MTAHPKAAHHPVAGVYGPRLLGGSEWLTDLQRQAALVAPPWDRPAPPPTVVPPGYVLVDSDCDTGRWSETPLPYGAVVSQALWDEYQAAAEELDSLGARIGTEQIPS